MTNSAPLLNPLCVPCSGNTSLLLSSPGLGILLALDLALSSVVSLYLAHTFANSPAVKPFQMIGFESCHLFAARP